jgi:hypothetical protein
MAHINGFAKRGLDYRDAFEDNPSLSGLRTFDAFREESQF